MSKECLVGKEETVHSCGHKSYFYKEHVVRLGDGLSSGPIFYEEIGRAHV